MIQPVLLQLLGKQMLLRDVELFIGGIAGHLNKLHPVQKGSGNVSCRIGRRNEQHL